METGMELLALPVKLEHTGMEITLVYLVPEVEFGTLLL
jgi:hypothetical protein